MYLVAWYQRAKQRTLHIQPSGFVVYRPDVFRETGTAKSEPRLEIRGRDVQLRVLAEEVHHHMTVDAELLAYGANLIAKHHFHRME